MARSEAQAARWLAWGFVALVALTTALIVLGALVRAHGAGLACPDWPQCFGVWIPHFDLQMGVRCDLLHCSSITATDYGGHRNGACHGAGLANSGNTETLNVPAPSRLGLISF